jgi:hypothetical protein
MGYAEYFRLRDSEPSMRQKIQQTTHIVKQRNKSLANLIELMFYLRYAPVLLYVHEYIPKRGKKTEIPLNLVIDVLQVSHRTAQDYVRTILILDELFDLKISEKIGTEKTR